LTKKLRPRTSVAKKGIKSSSVDALLEQAILARRKGQREHALTFCEQILRQDPQEVDALHLSALLLCEQGEVEEGIKRLRRAVIVQPESPVLHSNLLGIALAKIGDYQAAGHAIERSLEIGRQRGELPSAMVSRLLELADIHVRQKKHDAAQKAYEKLLDIEPNNEIAVCQLGNLHQKKRRYANALELYQRLTKLRPDSPAVFNNLGNALRGLKRYTEAAEAYIKANELDPEFAPAQSNLANVRRDEKRFDDAERHYRKAIELDAEFADAHRNLGRLYLSQRRFAEAACCFERTVQLQPNRVIDLEQLSKVYLATRQLDRALEVFTTWSRLEPTNPVVQHMLAAGTQTETPERASDGYIEKTFDEMAENFDEILEGLDYRVPELLRAALTDVLGEGKAELTVLDAGCGTGWCGPFIRPYAKVLVGVDLSSAMLKRASKRGEYDCLKQEELTTFLQSQDLSYDLIIAADVLVYFGIIDGVLAAAYTAMRDGGWLTFTLEELSTATPNTDFLLGRSGRYAHTEGYVRMSLQDAGFQDERIAHEILRLEHKEPVLGLVVLARK